MLPLPHLPEPRRLSYVQSFTLSPSHSSTADPFLPPGSIVSRRPTEERLSTPSTELSVQAMSE